MFRVGQEVVCITADKWVAAWGRAINPKKGKVYTIISIDNDNTDFYEGGIGLCFSQYGIDESFDARDFRPIVKTDISLFQAMLLKSPKKAKKNEPA